MWISGGTLCGEQAEAYVTGFRRGLIGQTDLGRFEARLGFEDLLPNASGVEQDKEPGSGESQKSHEANDAPIQLAARCAGVFDWAESLGLGGLLGRGLCRGEEEILIVETEVGQGGDGGHGEVVDRAVGIESEGEERVFDGVVAPVGFEGFELPVSEVALGGGGVVEGEDKFFIFEANGGGAVPRVIINAGVFFER